VIVPEANRPDLEEIPREAKRRLRFIPVKTMEQVLEAALVGESPAPRRRAARGAGPRAPVIPAAAAPTEGG
jgi:ATP-dependent Lon protease